MDGRDRDTSSRNDERPPRLRSSSTSLGRKGPTSGFGRFDDDLELSDDPPSWQERFGSSQRREPLSDRPVDRRPRREPAPQPPTDVYRSRSSRGADDDLLDERSSQSVADPYDRLRRVTERRSRPMSEDLPELEPAVDEPAPRRTRVERQPRASQVAPAARTTRSARPMLPQPQLRAVGSMLARSSQDAGALAKLSATALVSLAALAAITLLRLGATSDWLIIRLDAAGNPARWGTNESLWRVPLLVIFATVAGLVVAWRLRRYDAFAAQFTIVSVLLLHGFGWVAAGRLLFF